MRRVVPVLLACLLVGCYANLTPDFATPTPLPDPSIAADGGPQGDHVEADVVDVIDGDTIKVRIDGEVESVRYIGIDAPERGEPGSKGATAENRELVSGGTVVLERDQSNRDRYGRLLRYVWVRDGGEWLLVNRALVRMGLAVSNAYPPDTTRQAQLDRAESRARDDKIGIWADDGQIRPLVPPVSTPKPAGNGNGNGNCDPSYPDVCIPPYPPDLDCGDIPFRRFAVLPPDPHGFDGEGDGVGCESD